MGKFAQYRKRGSAPQFGSMAAPADADWTIGVTTSSTIPTTRVAPIPAGATSMLWRAIVAATGVAGAYTGTLSGLLSATQYKVQAAWFNGAQKVSDDSAVKLATTA